jgi:hypothetical protein
MCGQRVFVGEDETNEGTKFKVAGLEFGKFSQQYPNLLEENDLFFMFF